VSIVSPFIKFKNASKETIDASDELVDELRKGFIKAGQRLSRYLNRELRAGELERKTLHLEQFGPVLVETLSRIVGAPEKRKEKARAGLARLLETDTKGVRETLRKADETLDTFLADKRKRLTQFFASSDAAEAKVEDARRLAEQAEAARAEVAAQKAAVAASKAKAKTAPAKAKAKPAPAKAKAKTAPAKAKVKAAPVKAKSASVKAKSKGKR